MEAVPGVAEGAQRGGDVFVVLGGRPDQPHGGVGAAAELGEEFEGVAGEPVGAVDDDVAGLVGGELGGGLGPGVGGGDAVREQGGGAAAGGGEDVQGEVADAAAGGGADDEAAGAFDGGQAANDAVVVARVGDHDDAGPGR